MKRRHFIQQSSAAAALLTFGGLSLESFAKKTSNGYIVSFWTHFIFVPPLFTA